MLKNKFSQRKKIFAMLIVGSLIFSSISQAKTQDPCDILTGFWKGHFQDAYWNYCGFDVDVHIEKHQTNFVIPLYLHNGHTDSPSHTCPDQIMKLIGTCKDGIISITNDPDDTNGAIFNDRMVLEDKYHTVVTLRKQST